MVFPSNAQRCLCAVTAWPNRRSGVICALIDAGLFDPQGQPERKALCAQGPSGSIRDAFGFSLALKLARAEEIEHLAAKVVAEKLYVQHLREQISLFRRT